VQKYKKKVASLGISHYFDSHAAMPTATPSLWVSHQTESSQGTADHRRGNMP